MLSALIPSAHSYPAMLLAEQLVHQRCVHPGPLVLRTAPLKFPAPTTDRDRTVSRRSEPSSRTALMGEQPNPWDRLQPQDAMSRHRCAKPVAKLNDFIQRNIARASTTKRAQSRRKQLDRMELINRPNEGEKSASFSFEIERQSGNEVCTVTSNVVCFASNFSY